MATIPKASFLLKICLLFISAINIAAADRRSVLTDLYKQAAEQNRPLILIVDNHSKDEGQSQQGKKHDSEEEIPINYMYPNPSKSINAQEKKANKDSKIDLLQYYLSRLLQNQGNRGGLNKNVGRSDDRNDDYWIKGKNYRDDLDQQDRRDQYRMRHRDNKYNRRPLDRYKRPRESRVSNNIKPKFYALEDRDRKDRYDRDRRDRYRSERDREYRDSAYRYRSERDRGNRDRENRYRADRDRYNRDRLDRDRVDRYRENRNRIRDDRDKYRYQSQQRYQESRNRDRNTNNYGADVLKNLLRISNDLNCDAKYECKGACYERSYLLRNGDNCEDLCDAQYECDESKEKEVSKETKKEDDGCDGRGSDSCGDEKGNANISTRGYTDQDEQDCVKNNRC